MGFAGVAASGSAPVRVCQIAASGPAPVPVCGGWGAAAWIRGRTRAAGSCSGRLRLRRGRGQECPLSGEARAESGHSCPRLPVSPQAARHLSPFAADGERRHGSAAVRGRAGVAVGGCASAVAGDRNVPSPLRRGRRADIPVRKRLKSIRIPLNSVDLPSLKGPPSKKSVAL